MEALSRESTRSPSGLQSRRRASGTEDNAVSLEQTMQYMIDIQNIHTESFQDPQESVMSAASAAIGAENNAIDSSDKTTHVLPHIGAHQNLSPDLQVGRGQIIFSNAYYRQEQASLFPERSDERYYDSTSNFQYGEYSALLESMAMREEDNVDHSTWMNHFLHSGATYSGGNTSYEHMDTCCDDCVCYYCCCCCLWTPLFDCLKTTWRSDHLQRSFCDAAIDGMVTGAGLSAALVALTTSDSDFFGHSTRSLWMVAITFTACTADAICLALGHVWNTHVISTLADRDRNEEKELFLRHRSIAKAKLVDGLLARGMLKIDAVSIADTLEGYPDLFVGALVGEWVDPSVSLSSSLNNVEPGRSETFNQIDEATSSEFSSAQSRMDALVMGLAFSIFGTLPALVYCTFMIWIPMSPTMTARSASLTVLGTIMWMLGVWKSKYMDSNWILFGIETLVVLMVSVVTAYALGTGLAHLLGLTSPMSTESPVQI